VSVYNPAFDPTPMELVDYLVTETGVYEPPLSRADFDGERAATTQ
jgi:methylthioribose-1-phosphate isomerase